MKIERPIQLDFSFVFQLKYSLVMMAGSMLTSLVLYLYLDRKLGESYFETRMTLKGLEQVLPSSIVVTFIIQLILIIILTVAINLFVTHKIGGPVYRYELSLNSILKGDLRYDVHTRDGDQLKSMVGSLNGCQGSVRQVYLCGHHLHDEMIRSLDRISRGEDVDFATIRSKAQGVRHALGDFVAVEGEDAS